MNKYFIHFLEKHKKEKEEAANVILKYFDEKFAFNEPIRSKIQCLDVGADSGVLTKLLFRSSPIYSNIISLDIIEPNDNFFRKIDDLNLTLNNKHHDLWQNFFTEKKYDFILFSHCLGAIFKQLKCKEELIKEQLYKGLRCLSERGSVCIIIGASDSSDILLRKKFKKLKENKEILDSDRLETILERMKITPQPMQTETAIEITWLNDNILSDDTKKIVSFLLSHDIDDLDYETKSNVINFIKELTKESKSQLILKQKLFFIEKN